MKDIWFILVWTFYIIPVGRFMDWRLRRNGWRNAELQRADGVEGTVTDPDHWEHPEHKGMYGLLSAYETLTGRKWLLP